MLFRSHHGASHHGEDLVKREDYAKINRYHSKLLAYFLKKMKETPDGDGSLLDNTLLMRTSNMGNANQHSHVNVGYLLAGGASGKHKPKKLNVHEVGPTANVLVTAVQMMGVEQDSLGDSTRTIAI